MIDDSPAFAGLEVERTVLNVQEYDRTQKIALNHVVFTNSRSAPRPREDEPLGSGQDAFFPITRKPTARHQQKTQADMLQFEACCGYTAAAIACLAFGSFAVPIKSPSVMRKNVDPLVLQTYKIVLNFAVSMILVTAFLHEPFLFSPWGIVSGLFMVPGGTAGYYAVQTSGLAISQSIWSALKVLVSFAWSIFVFHEPSSASVAATVVAVLLVVVGLAGVGFFAAPSNASDVDGGDESATEPLLLDMEVGLNRGPVASSKRRYFGLLGAIIDGGYGGSVLVPMHFAGPEARGFGFVGSFAIGCLIVVCCVWIGRFFMCSAHTRSFRDGFESLPSFHATTVGPYAALAGLIWSIGNISSVVTVAMLGQGLGYSIVQSQLLIAGLWGVLWFREIRSTSSILRWFLFALITVSGMILLSQQHDVSSSVH